MKARFVIVLLLLTASLGYVIWHLWRITPGGWPVKLFVVGLFIIWMCLAFANLGLSERIPVRAAAALSETGYPWMIAFLYLLLAFILADVLSLFGLLPRQCLSGSPAGLFTVAVTVAFILVAGSIHYKHKYREELTIHTEKPLEQQLTVVMASDLHVGYSNRRKELSRWIDMINAEKPDIVLFGGDIVDLHLRPVLEGGYAEEFRRLAAPTFAVLGNHEYYGDEAGSVNFFADSGICLLRDSSVCVKGLRIIGRDDRSNRKRKPLSTLAGESDVFTILLDHQPVHLEEAEDAGIDFQFSGHTHRGQVWPLSWVTSALFEKAWGHHSKGKTRYYVSSGLGIWGPKIRIGTRSEYLVLHICQ